MALTGFTAPKLLWVKKHEPENFKKISKIMLPKDYIAYKLSGVIQLMYLMLLEPYYLMLKTKLGLKKCLI